MNVTRTFGGMRRIGTPNIVRAAVGGAVAPGGRSLGAITVLGATPASHGQPARALLDLFDGTFSREVSVHAGEAFDIGRRRWTLDDVEATGAFSVVLRQLR